MSLAELDLGSNTVTAHTAFASQWMRLAKRLGLRDDISSSLLRELIGAYGSIDRHYHGIAHVVFMLEAIDTLSTLFTSPDTARLATFAHDVIYRPGRSDNEERSAAWVRESLASSALSPALLDGVEKMVLATKSHRRTGDPDVDLLVDIDMSILGQPWDVYKMYAAGVMREYLPHYGDAAYRKGRVELFLIPTLAAPEIFVTETYKPLTAQARKNMAQEMELLQSGALLDIA